MAFCIKCGKKLNESDSFCPNCGNKVVKKVVVSNDDNINQESNLNVDANKENQPINHQQIIDQAKKSLNNLKQQANSQIKERPINISINQKFEKSTLVALISSAVVMISAFLPCISSISVSRFSVSMNISLMDIAKYMDYFDVSNDAASSGVFLSGICLVILAIGTIVGILMKNEKLNADRELMAQGIGNMLIPLFGGVPATAAIARTSVAIKAGGKTRLVSVFHSIVILISMFLLGSLMSRIPLSALAGVLMVTAWRMNDWQEIKTLFHNRVKTNISQYLITMCATVVFDLTVAIVIGVMVSIILFVLNNSHLHIEVRDIDKDRVGKDLKHHHQKTRIMYLSGPIFFGTQEQMIHVLDELDDSLEAIVFSMRGVPSIDDSGIHEFFDIVDRLKVQNCIIKFSGVQEEVMIQFKRNHFDEYVGKDSFCWDAIMALEALDQELIFA